MSEKSDRRGTKTSFGVIRSQKGILEANGTCGGTSKKPKTACGNIRGQLIGVLQGHDPPLLEKRLNEFRNPTGALVRH